MKLRWKVWCFLAVLIVDGFLCRSLYLSYRETKATLFLPADAGGEAREEIRQQFSGEKQIALTFDDGPHSTYTKELLDGLRERGIHATFFLLGENIDGKEDIVRQMQEDGHLIGNHGLTHIRMSHNNTTEASRQLEENNEKIQAIIGKRPEYFRPPFGSRNDELENSTDMTMVLWNVDTMDWQLQNTRKVVRNIVKQVEPGDIILLHDIFPTSVTAALEAIDTLQKQGYTFVTVEELLVD